jgi:hypothetical protein
MENTAPPTPTEKVEKQKTNDKLVEFMKTWTTTKRKAVRKKYFAKSNINCVKMSKCCVLLTLGDGRSMECGVVYRNPSRTTELEHLSSHDHLKEFAEETKLHLASQESIEGFTKQGVVPVPICLILIG